MAGLYSGAVMLDQPSNAERRPSYAAESWLEPWLIKHSSFYRKHLTRDGREESKSSRRHSVVSEGLASRNNSVSAPSVEAEASGAIATEATPAPVERKDSAEL